MRLAAARDAGRLAKRSLHKQAEAWPPNSPGALNAWLLLVTTKPPTWRDPLLQWRELPPTLGTPHEGFFYPDPLGFWTEVRRWVSALVQQREPSWEAPEALSVSACVHVGDDAVRLSTVLDIARPHVVLFLDEPSWTLSGLEVARRVAHHVPDPHRAGQTYEGFWGRLADGTVVGKSPQHPSTHKLYRAADMDAFVAAAPIA